MRWWWCWWESRSDPDDSPSERCREEGVSTSLSLVTKVDGVLALVLLLLLLVLLRLWLWLSSLLVVLPLLGYLGRKRGSLRAGRPFLRGTRSQQWSATPRFTHLPHGLSLKRKETKKKINKK
jgi:hypothetical protein